MRNFIPRPSPAGPVRPPLQMRNLQTERLVLREFQPSDLAEIAQWGPEAGILSTERHAQPFLNFCFAEYLKWGLGPWGMLLQETGVMVGNCGFYNLDLERKKGEVNYYVAPLHRGRGLATEALRALLQFGFSDLALLEIGARCDLENRASERVLQKAGMKFDREIHAAGSAGERSRDERFYSIRNTAEAGPRTT